MRIEPIWDRFVKDLEQLGLHTTPVLTLLPQR